MVFLLEHLLGIAKLFHVPLHIVVVHLKCFDIGPVSHLVSLGEFYFLGLMLGCGLGYSLKYLLSFFSKFRHLEVVGFFLLLLDAIALLVQWVGEGPQVRDLLLLQVFEMLNFKQHRCLILTWHFYKVVQLLLSSLWVSLQACDSLFKSRLFSLLLIDLLLGRGQFFSPQLLELGEGCVVSGDVVVAVAWDFYLL
jgi:hypothetical protein